MNKQQLASLIWEYCNAMRGSITTVEYKDIILGFIFYRFLSENEVAYLTTKAGWGKEEITADNLTESDIETVTDCKKENGYFISYENLFSTWKSNLGSFAINNITEALSAFERNISSEQAHIQIFDKLFKSFSEKIPKLGTLTADQTKAAKKIINIVSKIPMDDRQGYDVLGFIYEYLLKNFASGAGKKGGEFYTPYEISVLMSEIVADHLRNKTEISIYDSTSGSSSLLINIGKSIQKYLNNDNRIRYYAQEKVEDTYNLTRMNLLMRGVSPNNINARCADTLAEDWPIYVEGGERPIMVDCIVSNPPYSQSWTPKQDPRYKDYGIAPASKADYAFLLHDLYHLKQDGIMCIILPHGTLFRGGAEEEIRRNLINNNNIETIIGLPANIFFGTGIATIIMILKKHRDNSDVLFVDASKEFLKDGSKNKLDGHNIKKIVDAVLARKTIPHFATLVERKTIEENLYNLNIPRYVSAEPEQPYDIHACVFGNLPNAELDLYNKTFWSVFPSLREELFEKIDEHSSKLKCENLRETVNNSSEVKSYSDAFKEIFNGFSADLNNALIENTDYNAEHCKAALTDKLFGYYLKFVEGTQNIETIDKYQIYKAFDDVWLPISIDLGIVSKEDFAAAREVEEVEVYSKSYLDDLDKDSVKIETKTEGKLIPFDLIEEYVFPDEFKEKENLINVYQSAAAEYDTALEELSQDDKDEIKKESKKNDNAFSVDTAKLKVKYDSIVDALASDNAQIQVLKDYNSLGGSKADKQTKRDMAGAHPEIDWPAEGCNADGTYPKKVINNIIESIKATILVDESDENYAYWNLYRLYQRKTSLNSQKNAAVKALAIKAQEQISKLSDDEIKDLLRRKWITPIMDSILELPAKVIANFVRDLLCIIDKYSNPLCKLEKEMKTTESEVARLMSELQSRDSFDGDAIAKMVNLMNSNRGLKKLVPVELFSELNNKAPEMRFSGFSGDWNYPQLGELGKTYTGLSGKTKEDFGHGNAKYITYMNVFTNPITNPAQVDSIEVDAAQYEVREGDIFFTTSSETPEEVGMSSVLLAKSGTTYLNSFCFGYRLNENVKIDKYYLAYLLRSPVVREKIVFLAQGISRFNISKTKMMEIAIPVPEKTEEQGKIGAFFFNLDKLIEAQEKKIAQLKNIKSALLNKMFPKEDE